MSKAFEIIKIFHEEGQEGKKATEAWVGKILVAKEDMPNVAIVSGSEAHSGNIYKGQKMEVTGIQGSWLLCRLLGSAQFTHQPGLSGRQDIDTTKTYGPRGIVWGVSLNWDIDKWEVEGGVPE